MDMHDDRQRHVQQMREKHWDPTLQVASMDHLLKISKQFCSEEEKQEAKRLKYMEVVAAAMRNHATDAKVLQYASMTLGCLVKGWPELRTTATELGGVELLVDAMKFLEQSDSANSLQALAIVSSGLGWLCLGDDGDALARQREAVASGAFDSLERLHAALGGFDTNAANWSQETHRAAFAASCLCFGPDGRRRLCDVVNMGAQPVVQFFLHKVENHPETTSPDAIAEVRMVLDLLNSGLQQPQAGATTSDTPAWRPQEGNEVDLTALECTVQERQPQQSRCRRCVAVMCAFFGREAAPAIEEEEVRQVRGVRYTMREYVAAQRDRLLARDAKSEWMRAPLCRGAD